MKAIMYHYVRPDHRGWLHHPYLSLESFRKQLDYFQAEGRVSSKARFLEYLAGSDTEPSREFVLTFDDALADHLDFVLPELRARGLWGIFYIPTGQYAKRQLLGVHRIHALIGRVGAEHILNVLRSRLTQEMLDAAHVEEFHSQTYTRQQNSDAVTQVKRTLNYLVAHQYRDGVLEELMTEFFPDEEKVFGEFYVQAKDIRRFVEAGSIVGSHSVSHRVLARLSAAEQRKEITDSFEFLSATAGLPEVKTFCYPYGGFHSFNADTERLLDEAGVRFAFNVEQRAIEPRDVRERPQALPRYDCNQFPNGAVTRFVASDTY